MDHVYDVAFACRHWTVNRLAFCASAKSTVKLITQSETLDVISFFFCVLVCLHHFTYVRELHMHVHTIDNILIAFIWSMTHECAKMNQYNCRSIEIVLVDRSFKWKITIHVESSPECVKITISSNQQISPLRYVRTHMFRCTTLHCMNIITQSFHLWGVASLPSDMNCLGFNKFFFMYHDLVRVEDTTLLYFIYWLKRRYIFILDFWHSVRPDQ